jgi:hypothetical protein
MCKRKYIYGEDIYKHTYTLQSPESENNRSYHKQAKSKINLGIEMEGEKTLLLSNLMNGIILSGLQNPHFSLYYNLGKRWRRT